MARRGFWVRVSAGVIKPTLAVFNNRTWRGLEHIPDTGPAIVAVNHLSHVDTMVIARFVYGAGRVPRFLTKASVLAAPVIGPLVRATGQIPVHRGTRDAARALEAAQAAIADGQVVVVYPEGTTTRQPGHWPMRPRTGVARLALATGAPVIPVAQWGAQRLYDPISHTVRPRPRTPVTVVAGPPMDLSTWQAAGPPDRERLAAVADAIMVRIRDMLAEIRGEPAPELYEWPPRRDPSQPRRQEND